MSDYTTLKELNKEDSDRFWSGMIPCCCGCGKWGYGVPMNGTWYLHGHEPGEVIEEEVIEYELPPQKIDNLWWCRGMGWFIPASMLVVVLSIFLGKVAELILR